MQHLNGHQQFHRRALEKRQIRRVTTTVVTEPETTFTSTFTTRVPLIQIPGLGDDEDEETTTTSRRSSSSSSPSSSSTRPASSSAATARPTASSSVAPSSAISSAATSRPTAPSSSSSLTDIVTSFVTETNSRALPTTSDIASNSTAVGGAKSAGQVAGIVVGVLAGVIGVAIFAAFIVRHMKKRANDKEAWDAAKFRQSALLLNDEKPGGGGAGRGGPRPPSMIERREGSVMNVPPPSRAYPYTDVPGSPAGFMPQDQLGYNRVATPHQPQQYGAPNPYGAAPMAYTGQNMYGQGADRGYGGGNMNAGFGAVGAGYGQPQQGMEHPGFSRQNGAHNSLPPFASYAPRLEMDGHSFGPAGAVGNMSRTNTTASALPNPFSERGHPTPRDSSSAGHGTSESGGQHTASNRSRFMTRNGDEDDVQDQRDAPPAYIDDGSYAKMQRDVKTPVVMSVEGTAPTPASVTPPKPATPAPAPTSTTPAPAAAMGNNKARPMSSHTVYDPSDAYGGM